MRLMILLVLLLASGNGLIGASLKITGDDGWKARIRFENPGAILTPVFLIIVDKSGVTNTEALAEVSGETVISLGLPDGDYGYLILDKNKKHLLEGRFELKTPFQLKWVRILSDTAEFKLLPNGRRRITITLIMTNRPIIYSNMTISASTNIVFRGMRSLSSYRVEAVSESYKISADFVTMPRNVALNKPVAGTFTRLPESRFVDDSTSVITRVNDGKWEWFQGAAFSSEVNDREQFVYVNLERLERIRFLQVVWHALYYPESYFFVYGRDGRTWNVLPRSLIRVTNRIAPDYTQVKADGFLTNIEAFFVGILIPKGTKILGRHPDKNVAGLMEFEAYE